MRTKPFITGGLLACVLTLSVPALALGLGKLTVNSGLAQLFSTFAQFVFDLIEP